MQKIGIAVCGNSGIDYAMHDSKIRIFRSVLVMKGKEYEDFVDIDADEFYDQLVKDPDIDIHTAQTSTGVIHAMYEEMQKEGFEELIVITISSHLSGTYQNAVLAAKMMEDMPIHVFDSRTVSYPEAKMAHIAQQMAKEGKSAREILEALEFFRDNHHIYVTVDTLKYLVKNKIYTVDDVGRIMAEYYTNKDNLMKFVKSGKSFFEARDVNKEIKEKIKIP